MSDDTCKSYGCSRGAAYEVRGTPGHPWSGHYCDEHMIGHRGLYEHQGGFMVRRLDQTRWVVVDGVDCPINPDSWVEVFRRA